MEIDQGSDLSSKRTKGRGSTSATSLADGDYETIDSDVVPGEPIKCMFL